MGNPRCSACGAKSPGKSDPVPHHENCPYVRIADALEKLADSVKNSNNGDLDG